MYLRTINTSYLLKNIESNEWNVCGKCRNLSQFSEGFVSRTVHQVTFNGKVEAQALNHFNFCYLFIKTSNCFNILLELVRTRSWLYNFSVKHFTSRCFMFTYEIVNQTLFKFKKSFNSEVKPTSSFLFKQPNNYF